jgi:hypothetical protein
MNYAHSNDETRSDLMQDRIGELMHTFPFYGEDKARAIAETELRLIDEMCANDGGQE